MQRIPIYIYTYIGLFGSLRAELAEDLHVWSNGRYGVGNYYAYQVVALELTVDSEVFAKLGGGGTFSCLGVPRDRIEISWGLH